MKNWAPNSWEKFDYNQGIEYKSADSLKDIMDTLSSLPPLVSHLEVNRLRTELTDASYGKRFILQGGDCAESFNECNSQNISNKLKILLQMSLTLIHGLKKPVIRIGRIAGQYAKPRSSLTETQGNITLASYRGDLINQPEFSKQQREPNPSRLLAGYQYSAMTLNYLRALLDGGFADLLHPEQWDIDFFKHALKSAEYHGIVDSISNALDFLHSIDGLKKNSLTQVDFYTSHEALNLHYEQALTRQIENDKYYNLATHFPWIGMRTGQLDGAHLEYLSGIENPIGIKVGPDATSSWLVDVLDKLNPDNVHGKIMLITRFGAKDVKKLLPGFIKDIQKSEKVVLWSCDPMHGNTEQTANGYKTRDFNNILSELKQALEIHTTMDSYLGGVHFELTGENVTECIGGARGLNENDLSKEYRSLVDPRLNYEQSLEMALLLSRGFI